MPGDYAILPSQRLVLSRLWGLVTETDVREHYARLAADSRFEAGYSELIDLADILVFAVPSKTFAEGIAGAPFDAGARRALVMPSPEQREAATIIGIATADHGHVMRTFASIDAADRWLRAGKSTG